METENISQFKTLLSDFSSIYIPREEKTFMDICQYPRSRFEEICSRILAFYLNPNEEHSFRDLWFRALNKCIKQKGEYSKPTDINLILEKQTSLVEGCEKKRIDIFIETGNTVYVIENKIGAPLYNNLDVYSEHIKKEYQGKNQINIVLTAHNLCVTEKEKIKNSGFSEISYQELFEQVNTLLGDYITNANVKHLTFMVDFMKTINNKMKFMENKELSKFLSRNRKDIDTLIEHYNKWRYDILLCQQNAIGDLFSKIKKETEDDNWWIYQGWDLGICFNDGTNKKIGIESSFKEDENGNPLAKLCIYITTWGNHQQSIESWSLYENAIMNNEEFKNCFLDKGNNDGRVYLHVAQIDGENTDKIIDKLDKCYKLIKELSKTQL